jgi:hypothetical protein
MASEDDMRVFVSYRRADTAQIAGRVFDGLVASYGIDNVFKDVDSIPLGADFRVVIRESISKCDVMIILIGQHWLDAPGETGRRLDDANDFVRLEIEEALRNGVRVIPLLVDGASMPRDVQLPETLRELAYRNATIVRPDPDFHRDMGRVVEAIGKPTVIASSHGRSETDENWHPEIDSHYQIRIVSGPMGGRIFPLHRTRMIVGRGRDCDIVLEREVYCSRVGFDLVWDGDKLTFSVRSMARTPVFVNDCKASTEPIHLASGDFIRLGETVLRYEAVGYSAVR